ncbi:MAG: hypothetical protein LBG26_07360 [Treponema sp.]|nr:hypothetical protein [Treponema sp.]
MNFYTIATGSWCSVPIKCHNDSKTHGHVVADGAAWWGTCARTLNRRTKTKGQNGFEFAVSDPGELLSHIGIDAVTVSTPNVFHAETGRWKKL